MRAICEPISPDPITNVVIRSSLFLSRAFCSILTSETLKEKTDGHERRRAGSLQRTDPQTQRDRAVLRARAGLREGSALAAQFSLPLDRPHRPPAPQSKQRSANRQADAPH